MSPMLSIMDYQNASKLAINFLSFLKEMEDTCFKLPMIVYEHVYFTSICLSEGSWNYKFSATVGLQPRRPTVAVYHIFANSALS